MCKLQLYKPILPTLNLSRLYVFVYVYVRVYVCACVCVCVRACVYVCVCMYILSEGVSICEGECL